MIHMQRKYIFYLIGLVGVWMAFIAPPQRTVWMMGDSTMAIKDTSKSPETGWGMAFATLFKNTVQVKNMAKNGRSTRSFINEKRWEEINVHMKAGDYLFIQFGHNDEKMNKPQVGTSISVYKANLTLFVKSALAKGVHPVLLTPIERRHFENGQLIETHFGYPDAVRRVADSLHVPLIDLTEQTNALLSKMGEQRSKKLFLHIPPGHPHYPKGVEDNTHLNPEGAMAIAKLAAKELRKLHLDLANDLK